MYGGSDQDTQSTDKTFLLTQAHQDGKEGSVSLWLSPTTTCLPPETKATYNLDHSKRVHRCPGKIMTLRDFSGSALALTRGSDFPKCQLGPKYMWSRLEQRTPLSLMEWSESHALVQTKEFRAARASTCTLNFL